MYENVEPMVTNARCLKAMAYFNTLMSHTPQPLLNPSTNAELLSVHIADELWDEERGCVEGVGIDCKIKLRKVITSIVRNQLHT